MEILNKEKPKEAEQSLKNKYIQKYFNKIGIFSTFFIITFISTSICTLSFTMCISTSCTSYLTATPIA